MGLFRKAAPPPASPPPQLVDEIAWAEDRRSNPTEADLEWLVKFFDYYRGLGFFLAAGERTSQDLARETWQETTEVNVKTREVMPKSEEWVLLARDKSRVWWQDAEADVFEGNDQYVAAFDEWASISRGAFAPTNVVEDWQGGEMEDPMFVSFEMNGKVYRVQGTNYGDYFDLNILGGINQNLDPKGAKFASHSTGDQTGFIVCLTPSERDQILRERGLRFEFLRSEED
jgi:hypothetical protein